MVNIYLVNGTLADIDQSEKYSMKAEEHIIGVDRNDPVGIFLQEFLL